MQVTVINDNNIEVNIDQGRAGRGIVSISYQQDEEFYYLVVSYTDGTTQTIGPLGSGVAVALLGGTTGAIPYQDAPSSTEFLSLGNPDEILVAGTTAPEYKTKTELAIASSGENSDITSMSGITGGISTADFVQFDTAITPVVGVGKLQWDSFAGGPQIGMAGGNVNLQIGQETVVHVYNNTGATITEGQVVRVLGSQGQRLTVALAQANSDLNSATIMGMATENIPNNSSGFITTQGVVNNVNTNSYADGTILWLSPTTPGAVTSVKPVAPSHLVLVGYVVKGGSAGAGSIYIHVQNGYELEELHDVLISNPVNGNTLIYDASTNVWKNAALTAGTGISITNGPGSIIISAPETGTVTSVNASGGTTGLTFSGGPVTSSGTLTLAGTLAVANGGTNATTAADARTNLGAAAQATTISAGTGLSGGGDLSANRTLSIANTGVTAASYGLASNTLTATVNAQGQLTSLAATPIAIANTQVSGLGTASVLNAGTALGVATLDAGGTVPLSQIPASIQGGVSYQGSWNAATNTPTIVSGVGSKGYYYVVSVAGSTNIDGITDWLPGDWIIFNGTAWEQIDNTDSVNSVNGYTGVVVLTNTDVGAPKTDGTGATGTWNIGISGNAATVTNGVYTTGDQTIGGNKTFSSNPILSGGTANGVAYLNGSKVLTTGSALTFDGTTFQYTGAVNFATSTGNVGVGTTSPVSYAGFGYGPTIEAFGGRGGSFVTTSASSTVRGVFSADSSAPIVNLKTVTNHSLAFGVNDSEQMRLTSTGLGIGTSSPSYKLDVNGSGRFGAGTGNPVVYINGGAGGAGGYLQFQKAGANNFYVGHISGVVGGTGNDGLLYSGSGNGLQIYTNNTLSVLVDSSGNLGLGVTPSAWGASYKAFELPSLGLMSGLGAASASNFLNNSYFNGTSYLYKGNGAAVRYEQAAGVHAWYAAPSGTAGSAISFTQAMTLDASGNLLVGATSITDAERLNVTCSTTSNGIRIQHTATAGYVGMLINRNASDGKTIVFARAGTEVGSISVTTTATAYNTSSDYRLKENIQPMTGALAKVAALKPCTYKWKADGSDGEGFIAHELQSVVPQCVTGEKDAVDADGNPLYQGIDTSFLVATLTAAIQELKAEFDAYKASHP